MQCRRTQIRVYMHVPKATQNIVMVGAIRGLTLVIAATALILAIIGISRNYVSNSYYSYPANSSTVTGILAVPPLPVPLVEYGGIDLQTSNPTHIREDSLHRNMDSRETIYPAAIFRGSLAMLSGNLILDDASDVLIAGMDASLRGQILMQREMQTQICTLRNSSLSACAPVFGLDSMYFSVNCTCVCTNPLYIPVDGTCVLDCNNHSRNTTTCTCTAPYTDYSGCYDISCPINSFLVNASFCQPYNAVLEISRPPACANRSRASECLSRGNWFTDVTFFRDVVILNLTWAFNCSRPFISEWNPEYCSFQHGYPIILSTFDQWQDEIAHNILLSSDLNSAPEFADIWIYDTHLIGCIGISINPVASFRFVAAPTEFVNSDSPAYGSVYQIWSTDQVFCLLSRPLGKDEQIMYNSNCTGLVAIAANDPDLFTIPDSICGLFTIVDGNIQPFNSTNYINWANKQITFSNTASASNLVYPVPIGAIKLVNTTNCRALNCFSETPDPGCDPCIVAHTG